jgi:sulfite reductase alpha subunit-like flavoprotein
MIIHSSHSKQDLIELSQVFNIEIVDIQDLTKLQISDKLEKQLEDIVYIEPENTYYFVNDINELIKYLEEPNQAKVLTIAERERILQLARNIIFFCRNGYSNLNPYFRDEEDLRLTAEIIKNYGDISTCRKALDLLRPYRNIKPPIEPIISNRVKRQMERKKQLRADAGGKLMIKKGKVIVNFD